MMIKVGLEELQGVKYTALGDARKTNVGVSDVIIQLHVCIFCPIYFTNQCAQCLCIYDL